MKNNKIKDIFQREIEFKFKLEDLFALQFDHDEGYDEGYAYVEELKDATKKEVLATITGHIFEELKEDIELIKNEIYDEVRKYRKNGEIIIKDAAEKTLTFNLNDLKKEVLKELKDGLIEEVKKSWAIESNEKKLKKEILKALEKE